MSLQLALRWVKRCRVKRTVKFEELYNCKILLRANALWARPTKYTDWNTGPLARPFARLLTRSLAPDCSLRPPLRSFRSLPRSWGNDWLDGYLFCVFFYFSPHCAGGLEVCQRNHLTRFLWSSLAVLPSSPYSTSFSCTRSRTVITWNFLGFKFENKVFLIWL